MKTREKPIKEELDLPAMIAWFDICLRYLRTFGRYVCFTSDKCNASSFEPNSESEPWTSEK